MSEREALLWHLETEYSEAVRDPLWKHIYLSPGLARIFESESFQKLTRIMQLGPAFLVYPGATHTRAAHSLGVFHIAKRLVQSLITRECPGFLSLEGLKSFLAAALLHDLGHFPYAHSLKELPLKDHECLTADELLAEPLASLVRDSGADPSMVALIVDKDREASGSYRCAELDFFRGLLSGVLDPDKLDYLNRDAYYCGVPYGVQDIDFILSRLRLDDRGRLGIDSRGISSVESLLFAKYMMYKAVYWHRSIRSATSMVKKAVLGALADGSIEASMLYGLDDSGFFSLMEKASDPYRSLANSVFTRNFYQIAREAPFDQNNPVHASLLDLGSRSKYEAELAKELGLKDQELIIDIPEPISFESDFIVTDEGVPFSKSSTVFKSAFIRSLTDSLRVVRIFAHSRVANEKKMNKLLDRDGVLGTNARREVDEGTN